MVEDQTVTPRPAPPIGRTFLAFARTWLTARAFAFGFILYRAGARLLSRAATEMYGVPTEEAHRRLRLGTVAFHDLLAARMAELATERTAKRTES